MNQSNKDSSGSDFEFAYSSLRQSEREDIQVSLYYLAESLLRRKYKKLFNHGYRASDFISDAIEKTQKVNPIGAWRGKEDFCKYLHVVMRSMMTNTLRKLKSLEIIHVSEDFADSEPDTSSDPTDPSPPADNLIAEAKKLFAANPLRSAIYDCCIAQDAFKIGDSGIPMFRVKQIAEYLGLPEVLVENQLNNLRRSHRLAKLKRARNLYMEGEATSLEDALTLINEEK